MAPIDLASEMTTRLLHIMHLPPVSDLAKSYYVQCMLGNGHPRNYLGIAV